MVSTFLFYVLEIILYNCLSNNGVYNSRQTAIMVNPLHRLRAVRIAQQVYVWEVNVRQVKHYGRSKFRRSNTTGCRQSWKVELSQ